MGEEVRTLPSPLGLSDFELGVTLGTGSFGRVRFVTHKVRIIITRINANVHRFIIHVIICPIRHYCFPIHSIQFF